MTSIPPSTSFHAANEPIADALVITICAYTPATTAKQYGLLDREQHLYRRLCPSFKKVAFVTYGHGADHAVCADLLPEMAGRVMCICNDQELEPGIFLGTVPGRVRSFLDGCRTAVVLSEPHWGGDVAMQTTRELREAGLRVGLCARCGYHWSWTMSREHGTGSAEFAQARFIEGELCRAADVIVGTTPKIISDLAFQHALPRERVRLVPNFLITEQPAPPFATRTPGLIVTAGRLAREKRIDLLLRALAELPDRHRSSAQLIIVGSGPEEASLRALADQLRLNTQFGNRLPHHELLTLMGQANIYAQLSEYEGHPKTVLEAMAMGAPTLVCDAPGMTDHVADRQTGRVVPASVESVARGLSELLDNPESAASMGALGARHVRDALALDTIFPRFRQACIDALITAGTDRLMPASVVRWDQSMLQLSPDSAAANWASSMEAFAKRLTPAAGEVFTKGIAARLEGLIPSETLWATNDQA